MKFRKFGKALLMSAISLGAVLSVTSCVQSYTVGFLYVTGTQTSETAGQGIISGFKIDHNTGKLVPIHGLPVASGGAYPERAVLLAGSRFLYVLNRGGNDCTATSPCTQANIVQFAVGGNGVLSPQGTFYTQGLNPFRMFADATGNGTTGRLSLIENAQVSSASGAPLPYFPVPANPIDLVLSNGFVLTLSGTPSTGDSVFPYTLSAGNGQLSIGQNTSQPLNISNATALQTGNSTVYVLDNEPLTIASSTTGTFPAGTYSAQILPFTVGSGGALQAQTGGAVPDTQTQNGPLFLLVENRTKWVYVANFGDNTNTVNAQSGIAGFNIDTSTHQLTNMAGSPFGTGSGPRCLVEDPSNNFIYTANFNDSTVTGHTLDQNFGLLKVLPGNTKQSYSLPGPATYCLIDGRTS